MGNMPRNQTESLIPAGYSFFTLDLLISDKGREIVEDLLKKADNRNPDLHDMYIYNDFYSYACLDLVDKTLSTLHTKVVKRHFTEAYPILEGLAMFMDVESAFYNCDDGERVRATDKAYGALVVALFRGLEKEGELDIQHHPGLEALLKMIADWGQSTKLSTSYHLFCKALGEKLVNTKSPEQISLEKARQEEFIKGLSPEVRKKVKAARKEQEKDKPWYKGGHDNRTSLEFSQTRAWKEYKEILQESPEGPMRGGPWWDITDWTAEEKMPFLFSNMDEDSD